MAGDDGARFQTKGVAQGHTDGGSHLYDNVFVFVLQGIEHLLGIVFFDDGAGGADEAALAAEDAVGLFHGLVKGGGHGNVAAASGIGQGRNALYVLAGANTSAAADAFGWVAHDGGVRLDARFFFDHAGQVGF